MTDPPDFPQQYAECPACKAQICFGRPRLAEKDDDPDDRFLLCCGRCAAFLTWRDQAFVLLTYEEIAELSDDMRNMMLRQRREIESRVPFDAQCPMCHAMWRLGPVQGGAPPGPGDICVCGRCRMPLAVLPDGRTLRPVNRQEWQRLPQEMRSEFIRSAKRIVGTFAPERWKDLQELAALAEKDRQH